MPSNKNNVIYYMFMFIFQKLSTKLAIPQINWQKLNEEKNKTNKLLSEQRKALNKEKTVSYTENF